MKQCIAGLILLLLFANVSMDIAASRIALTKILSAIQNNPLLLARLNAMTTVRTATVMPAHYKPSVVCVWKICSKPLRPTSQPGLGQKATVQNENGKKAVMSEAMIRKTWMIWFGYLLNYQRGFEYKCFWGVFRCQQISSHIYYWKLPYVF